MLDAAEQVFAQSGFARTSMDEVAKLAGVTKPVVYDHFESKAALFFAAAERVRDELLQRGQQARISSDPETAFMSSIDAFFQFVEERPIAARLLFTVAKSDPTAAEAAAIVQARARATIAERCEALLKSRKQWQRDLTVLSFQRSLHAMAEWWLENPGRARRELVETAFALTWPMFRPSR